MKVLVFVAASLMALSVFAHRGHGGHGHGGFETPAANGQAILNVKPNGNIVLGKMKLSQSMDRDVIKLPKCRTSANKPVKSLKMKVKKANADIDKLVVVFQNGQRTQLQVREFFRAGTQSRWIDLPGNKRCIKKIIVKGDSEPTWTRRGRNLTMRQAVLRFIGK